ncbi:MAG: prolipoprotein diacylglyceryl transferase [Candidatus Competibacteraceae bacterium]|nr:prolipoprotein diacylglyceryl transferase [Candidatus Competibacteraceae bacterium]
MRSILIVLAAALLGQQSLLEELKSFHARQQAVGVVESSEEAAQWRSRLSEALQRDLASAYAADAQFEIAKLCVAAGELEESLRHVDSLLGNEHADATLRYLAAEMAMHVSATLKQPERVTSYFEQFASSLPEVRPLPGSVGTQDHLGMETFCQLFTKGALLEQSEDLAGANLAYKAYLNQFTDAASAPPADDVLASNGATRRATLERIAQNLIVLGDAAMEREELGAAVSFYDESDTYLLQLLQDYPPSTVQVRIHGTMGPQPWDTATEVLKHIRIRHGTITREYVDRARELSGLVNDGLSLFLLELTSAGWMNEPELSDRAIHKELAQFAQALVLSKHPNDYQSNAYYQQALMNELLAEQDEAAVKSLIERLSALSLTDTVALKFSQFQQNKLYREFAAEAVAPMTQPFAEALEDATRTAMPLTRKPPLCSAGLPRYSSPWAVSCVSARLLWQSPEADPVSSAWKGLFPMQPTLFTIAGTGFGAYACFLVIAFLFCGTLVLIRNRHASKRLPIGWGLALVIFVGAMFGSKVYWLFAYCSERSLMDFVLFMKSGRVFYGGLLGGVLGAIVYARIQKVDWIVLLDLCSPSAALGYAMTRLGCFLNGCCFGRITEMPWGVQFPRADAGPYMHQIATGKIDLLASASLPFIQRNSMRPWPRCSCSFI